jgi:hypothetical protein
MGVNLDELFHLLVGKAVAEATSPVWWRTLRPSVKNTLRPYR